MVQVGRLGTPVAAIDVNLCARAFARRVFAVDAAHVAFACLAVLQFRITCEHIVPLRTLLYGQKGVLNGCSSTRVSLWDSLMFGRLAIGFANVRAGTRVLMLVLVQAAELERDDEEWD